MKASKNLGMLLLAAWLVLTGLITLIDLSFSGLSTIMAVSCHRCRRFDHRRQVAVSGFSTHTS